MALNNNDVSRDSNENRLFTANQTGILFVVKSVSFRFSSKLCTSTFVPLKM
jgi:hypothetical protein